MNATELATAALAVLAVLTSAGTSLALAFRVGRLVGSVQASLAQGTAERAAGKAETAQVAVRLDDHLSWHRGPAPAGGRRA